MSGTNAARPKRSPSGPASSGRAFSDLFRADVRGPLIKALKKAGWDVVRAIDLYPERTLDITHFERAVVMDRILVTNDEDQEETADQWYREGRPFPGVVAWRQKLYDQITYGELVEYFESLAKEESPFVPYPILHPKPKR